MKDVLRRTDEETTEGEKSRESGEIARVVYTEPPILLAKVIGEEEGGFRIQVGSRDHVVACDASVDPAIVRAAIASGARVVLERVPELSIVGALQTAQTLTGDRVLTRARRVAKTLAAMIELN
jgi:hypothetical protein